MFGKEFSAVEPLVRIGLHRLGNRVLVQASGSPGVLQSFHEIFI
jgi:hypothetical protein